MSAISTPIASHMQLHRSILRRSAQIRQISSLQTSSISLRQLRHQLTPPTRRHASTTPSSQSQPDEPLIPPPTPTSGPLLTRLPNRSLPNISPGLSAPTKLWLKTLPIFLLLCALGSLSIFNYQKSSSSTVSSILYALRTSPTCRDLLGDEIYFASRIPWISGELNQLHGSIDISFRVKGKKQAGTVKFVSVRRRRDGYFETLEWSLTTDDGRVVQLLALEGARDPMGKMAQMIPGQEGGIEL